MMWEKLILAATITLILNLFVGSNSPSLERQSQLPISQPQAPIAAAIE